MEIKLLAQGHKASEYWSQPMSHKPRAVLSALQRVGVAVSLQGWGGLRSLE